MKIVTIRLLFLIIVSSLVLFSSFFILGLNKEEVFIDLLFKEVRVNLGKLVLISFISGSFITLILEILYFFKKKSKQIDK